ncbi:MAG: hypothetical protein HC780_11405 [Leptolyngbyaceae cyanobacterium CSU_1_3]|nr:hypothetical protein [Leptolyngbyaceae cyanobacterium CSU_1_3]
MINLRRSLTGFTIVSAILTAINLPGSSIHQPDSQFFSQFFSQGIAQASGSRFAFWQRRPRTRLVSRSNACPVSPGLLKTMTLWHDRPTFIWQGQGIVRVSLSDYETRKVLWMQAVNAPQQEVVYNGEPLQPGKLYRWQIVGDKSSQTYRSDSQVWYKFEVMATSEREQIKADLQKLEQSARVSRRSQEEQAIDQANYFADRELWSDALQVLQRVENPSATFAKQRQTYVANLCAQEGISASAH